MRTQCLRGDRNPAMSNSRFRDRNPCRRLAGRCGHEYRHYLYARSLNPWSYYTSPVRKFRTTLRFHKSLTAVPILSLRLYRHRPSHSHLIEVTPTCKLKSGQVVIFQARRDCLIIIAEPFTLTPEMKTLQVRGDVNLYTRLYTIAVPLHCLGPILLYYPEGEAESEPPLHLGSFLILPGPSSTHGVMGGGGGSR